MLRSEWLRNVNRQRLPPYREQKKNLALNPDSDQQTQHSLDADLEPIILRNGPKSPERFDQELDPESSGDSAFQPLTTPSRTQSTTEPLETTTMPFNDQSLATVANLDENCIHATMASQTETLPLSPFRNSVLSTVMALALTPARSPLSSPYHTPQRPHNDTEDNHFSRSCTPESKAENDTGHTIIDMPDTVTNPPVTAMSQKIHERRLNPPPPNIERRNTLPLVTTPRTWSSQVQSYWTTFTSYATPTTITVAVIIPILFVSCIFLL